ncbi:arylesterase [Roseovarius atlanticus]|uniref:arylesterase n=1 Tax=Roseovarius atlanticus TaxID=1641875 RepID=UPI001C952269|nr:arylesterase [Roseovarius atlanticus]MBY5990267.1 arylesterase [Roseovarius atlanticus]MBY6126813.1 arylesterase [Roseovarius atlanticus]MBY6151306.1 arylesterase [Roseovarius atlanticus]
MGFCLSVFSRFTYGVRALAGKVAALVFLGLPAFGEEPVTILALGDSLTQGYGLAQADGFVPQLQDWLEENDVAAEVINAGVSGDTTAGGASRVDWSLTPEVDAMIVALGGNDMLRGLDPGEARANLRTILEVAQGRELPVLLVGMQAPTNFGPDYKAAFDAMYPELSQEFGALYFESFFKGLGEGDPSELQGYFQSDGIHPNAEGVARIVEAMGPAVAELAERVE